MANVTATTKAKKVKKVAAASKKPRGPRVKPTHPRTSRMVNSAIKNLKERGGSSLQAIKNYISAVYKIDAEKLSPFIKNYLKSAVSGGKLIQTKGKGASGSFKLSAPKAEIPDATANEASRTSNGAVNFSLQPDQVAAMSSVVANMQALLNTIENQSIMTGPLAAVKCETVSMLDSSDDDNNTEEDQ